MIERVRLMKKILSLVLIGLMLLSSISVLAIDGEQNIGKWVHIELQDTKEQIVEVVLETDMYYATYLKNTSDNDISVEQIGENSEVIPKSVFSPTISGGTFPTDGAKKLKAGKYKFVIKSLGESNLSGTFSYMLSDNLEAFKNMHFPDDIFSRQIDIYNNGVLIELENKPAVIHEEVYLPLRELFEKLEIVDNKDSYINWDNGKIEIMAIEKADNKDLAYHYGIEIDKAEYVLNPGKEELYQQKFNISNKKEMSRAPMLIGDKTYVPYEYIDCMINKVMQTCKITYSEN